MKRVDASNISSYPQIDYKSWENGLQRVQPMPAATARQKMQDAQDDANRMVWICSEASLVETKQRTKMQTRWR